MDTIGYVPVTKDNKEDCKAHCAETQDGEGFFVFYAPLKTCHCAPSSAAQEVLGEEFVSGSAGCSDSTEAIIRDDATVRVSELNNTSAPASRIAVFLAAVSAIAATVAAVMFAFRRQTTFHRLPLASRTRSWEPDRPHAEQLISSTDMESGIE